MKKMREGEKHRLDLTYEYGLKSKIKNRRKRRKSIGQEPTKKQKIKMIKELIADQNNQFDIRTGRKRRL